MDKKSLHKHVVDFLNKADFAALATIAKDGSPSSATVIFVFDDEFNFYIPSHKDTQKYRNLERDPRASLTMYSADAVETIQLTGMVELHDDSESIISVAQQIEKKVGNLSFDDWLPISRMKGEPINVIKVIPTWMRYAQFGGKSLGNVTGMFFHDVIGKTKFGS